MKDIYNPLKKSASELFQAALKCFGSLFVVLIVLPALLLAMMPALLWNVIFHEDDNVDKWEGTEKELEKNEKDVKDNTDRYAQIILDALSGAQSGIERQIKAHCTSIVVKGSTYDIDYAGSLANVNDETGFYSGMGGYGTYTNDGKGYTGGDDAKVSKTGAAIADYAQRWIGYNYKLGGHELVKGGPKDKSGNPTRGIDCAGFVSYCYKHAGFDTHGGNCPQLETSLSKYRVGGKNPGNLAKGDILLFGRLHHPEHAAIYIGGGMIMSASTPKIGIVRTTLSGTANYHGGVFYAYRPFPNEGKSKTSTKDKVTAKKKPNAAKKKADGAKRKSSTKKEKEKSEKKDEGTIKVIHGIPKNAPYVYKTLREYGYDEIAAIGIMSCWWAESSFDPSAVNRGELASKGSNWAGSGIAQWTAERNTRMKKWVSSHNGGNWVSLKWQLAYFQHEVNQSYRYMIPSRANKTDTLFDAMHYTLLHYEGCDSAAFRSKRLMYAKQLYAALHGINPDRISGNVVGDDGSGSEGGGSGVVSGRFMGEVLSTFSIYENSMTGGWRAEAEEMQDNMEKQQSAAEQDGQTAYETELDSLYSSYTPPGVIRDIKGSASGKLSDECVKELDELYNNAEKDGINKDELELKAKEIIAKNMSGYLEEKRQERIDNQQKADLASSGITGLINKAWNKVKEFGESLFQPQRNPEEDLKNIMAAHAMDFYKITYGKLVKSGNKYVYSSITIQYADIKDIMEKCFDLKPDAIYSSKINKDEHGKPLPLAGKDTTNYRAVMSTTDNNMEMLYDNKGGDDSYSAPGGGGFGSYYDGSFNGGNGRMGWPCHGIITSEFGAVRSYERHPGMDIAVPAGTKIHAAADGKVIIAGPCGAYGNLVKISHGSGVCSLYGHNSRVLVRSGQKVSKGDVIALAGSTGRSTGPHCHFEIQVNGKPTNPRAFVSRK